MTSLNKQISVHTPLPGLHVTISPMKVAGVVTVEGSVPAGRNFAPLNTPLLPDVLAHMLDEGTKRRSKAAIQEALDKRGMSVEWGADGERIRFTGHCRSRDLLELLTIVAEEMREPAFPAKNLAVVKERLVGGLMQSLDDTRAQGGIALRQLLYPKGHPNWRPTTKEAVKAVTSITAQALAKYHQRTFGRNKLFVAVVGDIEKNNVLRAARRTLGTLPVLPMPPLTVRMTLPPAVRRSAVVKIPKKPSVDVFIATTVPVRKYEKDYYPLLLGARVLGVPGFAGRLMSTVREREGLTYVIYAYLKGFDDGAPGHVEVWGTFAPELLSKGVASTLREVRSIALKGINGQELANQKSMIKGSHLIGLSTTTGRANALLTLAEDGKSPAYLDEYLREIERISVGEVNRALRRHLNPGKLAVVAAGSIEKLPI